jgi:DNA-binding response OmpR family regulator
VARILIAEPDRHTGETIALCLERHGHEVMQVENGAAAIAYIARQAPELVLTEIMLPMRSGYEILASVERLGMMARLPVLFVTACSTEREMDRALAAGVSDYILKPFHPGELTMRANLALMRRAAAITPALARKPAGKLGVAA